MGRTVPSLQQPVAASKNAPEHIVAISAPSLYCSLIHLISSAFSFAKYYRKMAGMITRSVFCFGNIYRINRKEAVSDFSSATKPAMYRHGDVSHFFPLLICPVQNIQRTRYARHVCVPIRDNDSYLLHIECFCKYRYLFCPKQPDRMSISHPDIRILMIILFCKF